MIQDKRAIVTGSTRGIGLAIARALLDNGANCRITSRDADSVEKTVAELSKSYGARVSGSACNVRSYPEVARLFEDAEQTLGGLDILVNNAGVGIFGPVEEMEISAWQATVETNLSGVFYCCHEAIPAMKRRGGGYIINIASLAGKIAFAGGGAYNASKFGLVGFSDALMQEVRFDHIRVSCVMPGSVNSSFARRGPQPPESTWKLWPEDVAATVVHLLQMDPRALPSRVEMRPSEPQKS